ncbi:unnamed protein product [Xylocopa violacea]|uniref:Uncharacterized protein n=1 Tax=Xylocopa violacea TaxID=135666 RepID=A0ABP1N974_XYLVO
MFKLILIMAMMLVATSAAPAPVPPVVASPLIYSQPYVKVIPLHTATLPLTYAGGYKWYHPGQVYLY